MYFVKNIKLKNQEYRTVQMATCVTVYKNLRSLHPLIKTYIHPETGEEFDKLNNELFGPFEFYHVNFDMENGFFDVSLFIDMRTKKLIYSLDEPGAITTLSRHTFKDRFDYDIEVFSFVTDFPHSTYHRNVTSVFNLPSSFCRASKWVKNVTRYLEEDVTKIRYFRP